MTNANKILNFIQSNIKSLTPNEKVITLQTVREITGEQLKVLGVNPTYPNLALLPSFGQILDQHIKSVPVKDLINTLLTSSPAIPGYNDDGFVNNQISLLSGFMISISQLFQLPPDKTLKDLPMWVSDWTVKFNTPINSVVSTYLPYKADQINNSVSVNELNWLLLGLVDIARMVDLPADQTMFNLLEWTEKVISNASKLKT
jgi:hypothetical protein